MSDQPHLVRRKEDASCACYFGVLQHLNNSHHCYFGPYPGQASTAASFRFSDLTAPVMASEPTARGKNDAVVASLIMRHQLVKDDK
jgi:hypothetical protein